MFLHLSVILSTAEGGGGSPLDRDSKEKTSFCVKFYYHLGGGGGEWGMEKYVLFPFGYFRVFWEGEQ